MSIFDASFYAVNIHGLGFAGAGLALWGVGLWVFLRDAKSQLAQVFLFFSFTVSLWQIGAGISFFATEPTIAFVWDKILWLGVIFISPSIYMVTAYLLDLPHKLVRAWGAYLLFVPFAAALPFNLVIDGVIKYSWGYYPRAGILEPWFLVFFVGQMLLIFSLYVRALRKQEIRDLQKKQARIVFVGYLIAYVGALDYLPNFSVNYLPLGVIPITTFTVLIAYAIVRYKLFAVTPEIAAPTIISTMEDALLVADAGGNIVIANQAAARLLCRPHGSPKDLYGAPLANFYRGADSVWARAESSSKNTLIMLSGVDSELQSLSGRRVPVSLSISVLRSRSGAPEGLALVAHDMRKIQEYVIQLQQQKNELEQTHERLAERKHEAETLNRRAVDRELKMIELKARIATFESQLANK